MNIALVSMNASPLERLGERDSSESSLLVEGLARAFVGLGHTVIVYVRGDDPARMSRLQVAAHLSIVCVAAGPPAPAGANELAACIDAFSLGLSEAWRSRPPEVIHAFGWMSGKAAALAARGLDAPIVQTFHPLAQAARRRDALLDDHASIVRSATRIVATSSAHVFALLGLGVRPAAIKFVPCGVDLAACTPAARTARPSGRRLRIAALGSLRISEGIADVIEALSLVPEVELVVGGGPVMPEERAADPDTLRLHALARSRGVADRVDLCGPVERDGLAAFLGASDIVVCPPHDDAMGAVALAAMACGVPVIASAVGGLIDAVADGMTGIHVPPRAPRQIAYALEALRADAPRRERFGRFGIERTTARHSWSRIANETLEIYTSVSVRGARLTQSSA